jgi:acetolactate synthase-1/2/3 large subunit
MSVASHICDQLAGWGIDRIFGVSGANIELVFDAAVKHDTLDAVLAKHEAGAATMAIGWHERSGLPGVVVTTSGGASFNIVAPLTEALDSEIPLIALVGQCATGGEGLGAFQDSSGTTTRVNAQLLLTAASVRCERVAEPKRLPLALREAIAAAIRLRGPAVLLLPRDVQAGDCPADRYPLPIHEHSNGATARPSRQLARRLAASRHGLVPPLLIAGRDALGHDARAELELLADAWDAAIAVAPDAKSAIASDHPRLLGVTGVMGHPAVVEYARATPVCLLAGTRLPDVAGYGLADPLAHATIVSVNRRPCFPGLAGHPDVHELPGPTADVLAALRQATDRFGSHVAGLVAPASLPPARMPAAGPDACRVAGELTSGDVVEALAAVLEPGADVFMDAGNAAAFAIHQLPSDGIGLRSVALGMGAMGHAFGAAIGACEFSRRRTYVIAGDGAFYMHGMEVHTAIERGLPITFLIVNNNAHAMCRLREERLLGGATGANVFSPARIADGLGAMFPTLSAVEAESREQLQLALSDTHAAPGPSVISVTTAVDEQPPFWPLARTQTEQEVAA